MNLRILLIAVCLISSCTTVDITVRPEAKGSNPKTVLLGHFENRILDFNPFVVRNFKDDLACEFFTRGYAVRLLPPPEQGNEGTVNPQTDGNAIQELCRTQVADLFIRGTIFEARYGDAVEDSTSTAIALHLYNKSGAMIGTARCVSSDTLTNAGTVRGLAAKLVRDIHAKLSNE